MEFVYRFEEMKAFVDAGQQPVMHIARKPAEVFWVPATPLMEAKVQWHQTASGEIVRIPIVAYRTYGAWSSLMGVGVELGLRALLSFREECSLEVPEKIHLILGTTCAELAAEKAFRGYLGLAIVINH